MQRSRADYAIALAAGLSAAAACQACHKDFDGLFTKTGDNGPGEEAEDASGAEEARTPPPPEAECVCSPCKGPSCKRTCPPGCKSCECDVFTCEKGESCDVTCTDGTDCPVICVTGAVCTVTCAESAQCSCIGDATHNCALTCLAGETSRSSCTDVKEVCGTCL